MRARNIKPGLFKNEILGTEDPILSLLFIGLWCLADKEGRLENRPLRIKAEIFPYRSELDIHRYLTVMSRLGFIHVYEVDGKSYIEIVNFKKHQTPHHTERKSEIPENTNGCLLTVNSPLSNGGNPPDSLIPDSLIQERNTSYSCGEPSKQDASPRQPVFQIPLSHKDKKGNSEQFKVFQEDIDEWQQSFPAVDVLQALREVRQWNIDNPTKRKTRTGIRKHISFWIGKRQNRPVKSSGTFSNTDRFALIEGGAV